MDEDGWDKFFPDTTHDGRKIEMGNRPDICPGDALTYQSYDKPWANVSNAPFHLFKHYVHEGGISTPLVALWPNGLGPQAVGHAGFYVVDDTGGDWRWLSVGIGRIRNPTNAR